MKRTKLIEINSYKDVAESFNKEMKLRKHPKIGRIKEFKPIFLELKIVSFIK